MERPFLSRLSGALVALALGVTGLAAVGAASPASANDATCTTTTKLTVYQTTIVYGAYESLRGEASVGSCTGGTAATYIGSGAGAIYLERSFDGRTWQPVKSGTSPDYVSWYANGIVPATAYYRARYTGGRESTTYQPDTFSGSVSAPVRISVIRKLDLKDRSTRSHSVGKFKITPPTGLIGKKLVFQVKKGKKWKRYKKVKFTKKAANKGFKVTFRNSRKGISYRLVVPAASGLSAYTYGPFKAVRR